MLRVQDLATLVAGVSGAISVSILCVQRALIACRSREKVSISSEMPQTSCPPIAADSPPVTRSYILPPRKWESESIFRASRRNIGSNLVADKKRSVFWHWILKFKIL